MKTRVQFVKSSDGEITAIFPDTARRNHGSQLFMLCYAHIGQHGECSSRWVNEQLQAEPHEYEDLQEELTNRVGYDLEIVDTCHIA